MKNIISGILLLCLLLAFSSCKTVENAPLACKSNIENNEIVKIKKSGGIIAQKKATILLGGVNFYIMTTGSCNDDYNNPAITNVSANISGTISDITTISCYVGGYAFPSGSTITISGISGVTVGEPVITTDMTRHTKTIIVEVYVTYTITAKNGDITKVETFHTTMPLSVTIEAKTSIEFFPCNSVEKKNENFKLQTNGGITEAKVANDKNDYSITQNFDVKQEYANCLGDGYAPCSSGNMKHTIDIIVDGIETPAWYWGNGSMTTCTFDIRCDKNNRTYNCAAKTEVTVENVGVVYEKSIEGKKYKAKDWLISVDTIMSGLDLTVIGHKITSKKITGLEEVK